MLSRKGSRTSDTQTSQNNDSMKRLLHSLISAFTGGTSRIKVLLVVKYSAAAITRRNKTDARRGSLAAVLGVSEVLSRFSEYEARDESSSGVANTSGSVYVSRIKSVGCC